MKFGIKVMPREVILDTQGRAVEQTLRTLNTPVASCRIGKFIELEIDTSSLEQGLAEAHQIAKSVLHNPLIENYEITKL